MKKINFSKRRVAKFVGIILVIAAVGLAVYGLFELQGLRARVHTLEYAKGDEARQQAEQQAALEQQIAAEKIDYKVLSKTTKTVRVTEDYYGGEYGEASEPTYKEKEVIEYRVKITNNTTYVYDGYSDIRGKTKNGTLVNPLDYYTIHEDDRKGAASVSLAPGGSDEIYLYMPADKNIEDLYFGYSGGV